ncbi:hypothetical protein PRIPAC_88147 [Pristionchus pacificus]|uniref:Uncharacterized protein n=1 Tax=Pristionchus pacificus TaxID=54126 RepID=A0A2A6B7F3_PRIPA|nr:hypothetical protein PRIPAC_88147 [Pristionchus pacificus]|eukprot:PDM61810.1 hypothetical protein PRIPAC_51252 [Pristionchus pacificus]
MRLVVASALMVAVVIGQEVHVTLAPALDPSVPLGTPVVQDAPLAVSSANNALTPLTLQQPIEVAEPIILPADLEERQDTVVRQTASSGKLQHILRAHYVGQQDNEQTFEAQDAAEPAALPKTPRVSLNELFFAAGQQPAAPAAPTLPYPYPGYPPYPYGGYPFPYGPYGAPFAAPAALPTAGGVAVPARV